MPVIKMNFDGIELDMLFARLALKEIPDNMVIILEIFSLTRQTYHNYAVVLIGFERRYASEEFGSQVCS